YYSVLSASLTRRPPASTLFPTRRSSDLRQTHGYFGYHFPNTSSELRAFWTWRGRAGTAERAGSVEREHHYRSEHSLGLQLCAFRSEEHTSELQSRENLVCRLLLEKKKR